MASKLKIKHLTIFLCILFILNYLGAFTHLFELDFYDDFSYPYDGDVQKYVKQIRDGLEPEVKPINIYNQSYLTNLKHKCDDKLRLIYLVKSARDNFKRRIAIRSSWGFEKRFSDVKIRTIFLLGSSPNDNLDTQIQEEYKKYRDILIIDYTDSYFNNTYKTINGIKWAATFCPNSDFYFFSDDDIYLSTKNVFRFIRNPTNYPKYLETAVTSLKLNSNTLKNGKKNYHVMIDYELPEDVVLYAGYVYFSPPHRHQFGKWYVPLSEYPYHLWPPYCTAGFFILSKEALLQFYYTSQYTKHFRFDDIYLGLIALKANIQPFHSSEFYVSKKPYRPDLNNYKYVIASHGYEDSDELIRVWSQEKEAGNA